MPLTSIQKQILEAAQATFMLQTGLMLEIDKIDQTKPFLLIKAPVTTAKLELIVNGNALAVNELLLLCNRLENLDRVVMVVPQATADQADRFRELGIQFIDTAGNGYINQLPLYLFIKGNKTQNLAKVPQVNRVFKQTGLRVLYALLCNPGLENETYRTIAAKTNVALGMVNWVFKDLNELGFLMETGAGRARQLRLIRRSQLLDRWITAYAEQLRPRLILGRYRGADEWWQKVVLKPEQALWGGEVAAARLTEYLKPQVITVYVDKDNPGAVLIQNRLKKDPQGDVELVARFWQQVTVAPQGDAVHPLLVYADLMATGNQRNMEAARIIYDEHILELIGEN